MAVEGVEVVAGDSTPSLFWVKFAGLGRAGIEAKMRSALTWLLIESSKVCRNSKEWEQCTPCNSEQHAQSGG